jgi:hypothetical protein
MIDRRFPPQGPPQAIPKTLKYRDAEEHFVRRLGAALVLQWDALSDDLQDLMIDQAALVDDRDPAPHSADEIESFVRNVKVAALAKAPAAAKAEE